MLFNLRHAALEGRVVFGSPREGAALYLPLSQERRMRSVIASNVQIESQWNTEC